jgi:hypothetical protein
MPTQIFSVIEEKHSFNADSAIGQSRVFKRVHLSTGKADINS